LATLLAKRAESVARYLLPSGKRVGNEWRVGSVRGHKGKSLGIHLTGDTAGVWMDFANRNDTGDLVELWTRTKDISKTKAIKEIKQYLGIDGQTNNIDSARQRSQTPVRFPIRSKPSPATQKLISREYHQSLRGRLLKSEQAMAYLTGPKRGLTRQTIDHFGLGLSSRYTNKDGVTTADAVVAPIVSPSRDFLARLAKVCVPGLTQNPTSENSWTWGEVTTYWSDEKKGQALVFVCEGLKDLWRHWQALAKTDMSKDIILISSTHGSAYPAEWEQEEFWSQWKEIYLGHDNDDPGDMIAERLLEFTGRQVRRVRVPKEFGKDWTDYWQNGGDIDRFRALLSGAPVASAARVIDARELSFPPVLRPGCYSYNPVDINGAYINGHLYYPTEIHVVEVNKAGVMEERLETIVIRSDRTIQRVVCAPAPTGTPADKKVFKLTDGTIVESEPRVSSNRTWAYESIGKYINGTAKSRGLQALVQDLVAALQQAVWLPYSEDYAALALTALVTYVQTVFESVPLILMNGPAGSGKTQAGNAMARLSANGKVIGQVSAATAARVIDETRGLVVLDDVESIAAKAGRDIQVTELVQALKVSYNQHTAIKMWTDVKTMRTEKLNFFGVKILNNTLGADFVLGSRMIRIQTRKMPEHIQSNVREFSVSDLQRLRSLRNELHVWAFENVTKVDKVYREVFSAKSNRDMEIAAPLRTMARLIGDPQISAMLESCLARQHAQQHDVNDDPVEILSEAVRNIIKQGYEIVTIAQLRLEMRTLLDVNYGITHTTDIPEWDQPEWLGRQLRSNDLVADVNLGRRRFFGKNLRLVKFANWIIEEARKDEAGDPLPIALKAPDAFCQGCANCPYRNAGCELQILRLQEENRRPRRTIQ
jgi:hypothetical protein